MSKILGTLVGFLLLIACVVIIFGVMNRNATNRQSKHHLLRKPRKYPPTGKPSFLKMVSQTMKLPTMMKF